MSIQPALAVVEPAPDVEALIERFRGCEARIGIVGLGYVGLPLLRAAVEKGFPALGFDVDRNKVDILNAGGSYIRHIEPESIARLRREERFSATDDFRRLAEVDAIILCVPTPLTRQREPDLTYVVRTTESIAPHLRPGQLVVLESTTYPGTTREIMRPILETSGLRSGRDFFLAYSPEREDPGNDRFGTRDIPKVVGGDGDPALRLACAFYDQVVARTVPVSSTDTAEAVKLTENIFRSVNIALVNELKLVFSAMGIDIWEVIEAARTKPFGFAPFYPGPGLGGHCIPIDPFYLTWKAREYGLSTRFIELAGEVNTGMPGYVVRRLTAALNEAGKPLRGTRVLVLGAAYKKNIADVRESPALEIIEMLQEAGARVDYHDPHIPFLPKMRRHQIELSSVALDGLAQYDAAIVVTDHASVDYQAVAAAVPLIVDTRNVYGGRPPSRARVVKA